MPLPVLRRLRKRRHRDRTDPETPRTPKRRRAETKVPSSPAKPHTPAGTHHVHPDAAASVLDTPASARTLSPWASSSPTEEHEKRSAKRSVKRAGANGSLKRRNKPPVVEEDEEDEEGAPPPSFSAVASKLSMVSPLDTLGRRALRSPRKVAPRLSGVEEENEGIAAPRGLDDTFEDDYDTSLLDTSLLDTSASLDEPKLSDARAATSRIRTLLSSTTPPSTIALVISLVDPLSRSLAALESNTAALSTAYTRMEATVAELEGENDELREDVRRLMLARKVAEARAAELENQVDEMRAGLAAKGEKITKLRGAMRKIVRI